MVRWREADGQIASRESRRRRADHSLALRFVANGECRPDARLAAGDGGNGRDLFGRVGQALTSSFVVRSLSSIGAARGKWTARNKVDLHLESLAVRGSDILKLDAIGICDLVDQIADGVVVD